jgi:tetratricopeptide (TPR) repeat protein
VHPVIIVAVVTGVVLAGVALSRLLRRGPSHSAPDLSAEAGVEATEREALELLAQGDAREARRRLQALLKRDPERADMWKLLARIYLEAGDPDEAIEVYTHALSHIRSDPDLHLARAEAHMVAGQPARAFDDYDMVLDENAERIEAWIGKSQALLAQNRPEAAQALLEDAVEQFGEDPALSRPLAEAYFASGEFEGALECWEAHLQEVGDDPEVLRLMAEAHRHLGNSIAAAECLRRADEAAPENPLLSEDAAHALLEAGQFEEAARAYAEARTAGLESPIALLRHSEALQGAGRPEEAYATLVDVLDLGVEAPADRSARATALLRLGLPEAALVEVEALAAEGPRHRLAAMLFKLEALHSAGRREEAAQVWTELDRGRFTAPNVMGRLYWWGMCLGASPQDAMPPWLDEHIEQRPNDRFARLGRAQALRTQGDLEGALRDVGLVLDRNPADVVALHERAAILKDLGRDDDAARDLAEADRLDGLRRAAADEAALRLSQAATSSD